MSDTLRFSSVIPYLFVRDFDRSLHFYCEGFGLRPSSAGVRHLPVRHVQLLQGEVVALMFSPEGALGGTECCPASLGVIAPQTFYLHVSDVDAAYARVLALGAKVLLEPCNLFWGERLTQLEDLDGYRWALAQSVAQG